MQGCAWWGSLWVLGRERRRRKRLREAAKVETSLLVVNINSHRLAGGSLRTELIPPNSAHQTRLLHTHSLEHRSLESTAQYQI